MLKGAVIRAVRENYNETRQLALMLVIKDEPDLSVRELAVQLGVPKQAAARALDALVFRGLVSRTTSLEDRRLVKARLTRAGRASLSRIEGEAA
jgi:DNA-binding MarR family transcriptional regulator